MRGEVAVRKKKKLSIAVVCLGIGEFAWQIE
jgi:hypothetical protein